MEPPLPEGLRKLLLWLTLAAQLNLVKSAINTDHRARSFSPAQAKMVT